MSKSFKMYDIHYETNHLWFDAEEEMWTDKLKGNCLFPIYELTFDVL